MLTIKIKDQEYTLEEAKELYNELNVLFGNPTFPLSMPERSVFKAFTPVRDLPSELKPPYKITC